MSPRSFIHRRRHLPLGVHLIAGAVGVLAGLQSLFGSRVQYASASEPVEPCSVLPVRGTIREGRPDYFFIRRSKSESGYGYWVLQGYGEFRCVVLFDTWREAVNEALRRVSDHGANTAPALVKAMAAA